MTPVRTIDVNCDMGESFGAWHMGSDAAVMPFITSANIACGYHAGDPGVMRETIRRAVEQGVAVRETPILQQEIGRLDELFITGTTSDVTPIVQLDGRPIGDGKPGRITRVLASALERKLYGTAPANNPSLAAAR